MKKVTQRQINREFTRDLIVHGVIITVVLITLWLAVKWGPVIDMACEKILP